MFAADHIVDIGPGAGRNGGEVVFEGTIDELLKSDKSITGQYLSGKKFIPVPEIRRKGKAGSDCYPDDSRAKARCARRAGNSAHNSLSG